jgi:poly(3-hydroxybutyrate) depolymerase
MSSGGAQRSYSRHVPPAYDGEKPLSVVVELHGLSAGASLQAVTSKLGASEGWMKHCRQTTT